MADLQRNLDIGIGSSRAKTGAAKVRAALDSIKRKSRATAAASERDSKRMGKGFALAAKAALALASVFALKGIVSSTKDFGQAVADLSAITGATGKDLEFLRDKSKEFGETTTLSASQAAEAFKIIASAKPDLLENAEALSLVTEEAIALAEATGEDLPSAANALGASLNQFGADADQASRFINVMAAGSKRGAALVAEVAESLKQSGVIAAQAGLSFEETNAVIQILSTNALKGSKAGNQFRGVILALAAAGRDEFNPEVVGMTTALENMATANLTTAEKVKIFGRENLAAANILIANRAQLAKLTGQLTGTSIAYEQQAIRVDTLAGDTLALKSAYEGLELTIGAALEPTLRAMTQAATESIRELSKNPFLKKATVAILDTVHRALDDIRLMFMQLKASVIDFGGGAAVFEGVWAGAIENVVKWTKFLWEQFVIGGPANLKLGITLMIAAFDRLRIDVTQLVSVLTVKAASLFDIFVAHVIEKVKVISPTVQLVFQTMANVVGRTFDNIIVTIAQAVDNVIGAVQQKIFNVARSLANLGFEERAREFTDMGIALGKMAQNGQAAADAAKANEDARLGEIDAILEVLETIREEGETKRRIARETADALINEYVDTAEAARLGSQVAVQGAIDERDATLEAIKALREKRAEIVASAGADTGAPPPPEGGDLGEVADEAADAYENLGDIQKNVVDGMADGIAEMAASGKASFKDLAASIIQDIIRIYIKSQLLNALSSIFGGFSAGTGAVSSSAAGAVTVGPPARQGSQFMVGGSGGLDSQLVAFRASPGEEVSVKTPGQQRMQGGGVTVKQTNVIDARGADAERIEALLPSLLEQNRQRTLQDVLTLRNKGLLRI